MTATTNNGPRPSLLRKFEAALTDYETTWRPIDDELYALCRRLESPVNERQVYTKVVMIGRVYTAGIARSIPGERNAEKYVAGRLADPDTAAYLERSLSELEGRRFDSETTRGIVGLHGHLVHRLTSGRGGRRLTSFVSKYLHFHCSLVPLYDGRAVAQVRREVRGQTDRRHVKALRDSLATIEENDSAYGDFVAYFLGLKEMLDPLMPQIPTVKQVDHFLWRAYRESEGQ